MTATVAAGAAAMVPVRAAASAPTRIAGRITLVAAISYQGGSNYSGFQQALVEDYLNRRFGALHPGTRVTTIPGASSNGNSPSAHALIAAAIAGAGPDIMSGGGWQLAETLAADMLRPLNAFIRQANIDLRVFDPGHLAVLNRPVDGGIIGLPAYDGPMVLLVNYSVLDALGLRYPAPDWDGQDAVRLWSSISGRRVGNTVMTAAALDTNDPAWQLALFGGSLQSADGRRCTADSTACVEALTWMRGLIADKTISPGGNSNLVRQGKGAFEMNGAWDVQNDLAAMQALGVKWDWLPMPVMPRGKPSTYNNSDWYGISAYSRHDPELLWDLFYLVALDPGMQRLMFRTTLVTPNQSTLWPDWLELVKTVAPPLRDKHLEYYQQATGYGVCNYRFPYSPAQCDNLMNNYVGQILAGQISPELGLQQAARQINAIQAAGAAVAARVAAETAEVRQALAGGAASAVYPAPPVTGMGQAPASGAGLLHAAGHGAFTLVGDGADVLTNLGDSCSFAGAAATATTGTFVCRVSRLANVNCPSLSPWAKVGLMARGDLSSNAAAIAIEVTGGNGINLQYRVMGGVNTDGAGPGSTSGLLPAAGLTLPGARRVANYLLRPVWLMLRHDRNTWSAYTSLDGAHWQPAGPAVTLEMAGAWVGIFACAHNSDTGFRPGQRIAAGFDHLQGFSASRVVQIGTA